MNARAQITRRHNGGPPLDDVSPAVHIGEKFLPLFDPKWRHLALFGGRGSAKSHTIATALSIITANRTRRVVCARQFQSSIKESVKELLEHKMRQMRLVGPKGYKFYEREIVHEGTGSRYIFIGLDRNPDSAKSLEGADECWVEEARTINKRSFEILIPTIRRPHSRIIWSWNPEYRKDEVDMYFRGAVTPPDSWIQQFFIEDNPYFYHTPLANEMWFMKQGNPLRYKHIWLGDYDESFDTKIFTNVEIGRVEVGDHIAPRYGLDFGFGAHPFACVKVYILEAERILYIAREAFGHGVPLRHLPSHIRTVIDDESDYIKADSAAPIEIEHLNANGFTVDGAKKGPGSVKAGINWIQGYKVVIDPDCENMRDEARMYTWQVDKVTKKRLNVPVDAHNHGWDAVRYACEDYIMTANIENPDDSGVVRLKF